MSNIVLADEINRASPRAQSALLEAMEEGASPWTAIRIRCLPRSSCWQRKIRTNMKAQAACRRRSWTAFDEIIAGLSQYGR